MPEPMNYTITGRPIPLVGAPYFLIEVRPSSFSLVREIRPTSDNAGLLDFDDEIELILDQDIVEEKGLSKPRLLRVKKQGYGISMIRELREVAREMGFPYVSYTKNLYVNLSAVSSFSPDFWEFKLTPRFFNRKYDLGINHDFLH